MQYTQDIGLIKADENPIAPQRAPHPTVKLPKIFIEPPHFEVAPTIAEFERTPPKGDEIEMGPTFTSSTILKLF